MLWFLVAGALLLFVAVARSFVARLPLSTALIYLAVGVGIGPLGLGLISLELYRDAHVLERIAEIVVLISLFTAGLKLRLPLRERLWRSPFRLATVAMVLTIGLAAALASFLWGLSLGLAVLLAATLAPTDPVLASDVQVEHAADREPVRFALTGEGGLNDGMAFPLVLLGLGLLGHHELGSWGARWVLVDVLWAAGAGIGVGALCATGVGRLVVYLRRTHREATGTDDFLALGLIAFSYGLALMIHAYGFLAVFAAGVAVRRIERRSSREPAVSRDVRVHDEDATHPHRASAHMAENALNFNAQLERACEVAVVVLIGSLLSPGLFTWRSAVFAVGLFVLIRPAATAIALWRGGLSPVQRRLIAWFGIRGVGSVYYIAYASSRGLSPEEATALGEIVIVVVALSALVHGVTVTPIMRRYGAKRTPAASTR